MGEVLPFCKRKPEPPGGGSTLCRHGFHKWLAAKENQFDVKQGKLVTVFVCARCGKRKVEAR